MIQKKEEIIDPKQNVHQDKHLIFSYTPTCGTCKVSERMLDVANEMVQLPITKIDLNLHPDFAQEFEIQSVPVLLIMSKDQELKRIYAFQSVPYLLENLK
ncbi:thioredoxin family protein [Staphylococcus pettenkoferi]|uniref:thioredoxin family protein n=1 Tax=Staphylococcus pettenkoferi TaxID=170573 RepID=UPI0011A88011|nr:thioredoxin family protein [Staphylococcus pettenkoferi]MDK7115587.1 thioredoxin family protein [Staphylococcus pettenkoferi]MDK7284231.1 thioredoxin family protein [Staphylococcus pettenkoferi]